MSNAYFLLSLSPPLNTPRNEPEPDQHPDRPGQSPALKANPNLYSPSPFPFSILFRVIQLPRVSYPRYPQFPDHTHPKLFQLPHSLLLVTVSLKRSLDLPLPWVPPSSRPRGCVAPCRFISFL